MIWAKICHVDECVQKGCILCCVKVLVELRNATCRIVKSRILHHKSIPFALRKACFCVQCYFAGVLSCVLPVFIFVFLGLSFNVYNLEFLVESNFYSVRQVYLIFVFVSFNLYYYTIRIILFYV